MIPFLLALAATSTTVSIANLPGGDAARFAACVALVKSDPKAAVEQANVWRERSRTVVAAQCLGLAFVADERWAPASAAFEQAARQAELDRDGRAATLWVQAANAALAADDALKARGQLDRALALPILTGQMRGEAYLDRARADAAIRDFPAARTDLDEAVKLVPQDPLVWLLSATLARRQMDMPRAEKDIARALELSPDDGSVAYEAGNIAATLGRTDAAKVAWEQAVKLDKDGPAGKAAAQILAQAETAPEGKPSLPYDALDGE